jgi:uncharacterized protein (TIGR02118 family)
VKTVILTRKREDLSHQQFVDYWTSTHADLAATMPGLQSYAINIAVPSRPDRRFDGYAVVKFPSRESADLAWRSEIGRATVEDGKNFLAEARAVDVDEQPEAGSSPAGGVKFVSIVKRKADVPHEKFVAYWTKVHAAVVSTLPELQSFSVNLATPARPGTGPIDGYAALQFPSVEAAHAAAGSDVGQLLSEIQSNFAEEITATQVREVGVL